METALIHSAGRYLADPEISFNPCFIGNCSHTIPPFFKPLFFCDVSILVLLETALIPKACNGIQGAAVCFNPCFIGNCSHTKRLGFFSLFTARVSILVLLETALILPGRGHIGIHGLPVSILVLLETALILILAKTFNTLFGKFQSLFYWKLLSYFPLNNNIICIKRSFNPCFIGNCSHTGRLLIFAGSPEMFQSLFYWKLLSYIIKKLSNTKKSRCFNPCFIGNCSHTREMATPKIVPKAKVSILVLLETALILCYKF